MKTAHCFMRRSCMRATRDGCLVEGGGSHGARQGERSGRRGSGRGRGLRGRPWCASPRGRAAGPSPAGVRAGRRLARAAHRVGGGRVPQLRQARRARPHRRDARAWRGPLRAARRPGARRSRRGLRHRSDGGGGRGPRARGRASRPRGLGPQRPRRDRASGRARLPRLVLEPQPPENLVCGTRMQNVGANDGQGGMAMVETACRSWLRDFPDQTISYVATPLYVAGELVPRSVVVDARSSDGSIDEEVGAGEAQALLVTWRGARRRPSRPRRARRPLRPSGARRRRRSRAWRRARRFRTRSRS